MSTYLGCRHYQVISFCLLIIFSPLSGPLHAQDAATRDSLLKVLEAGKPADRNKAFYNLVKWNNTSKKFADSEELLDSALRAEEGLEDTFMGKPFRMVLYTELAYVGFNNSKFQRGVSAAREAKKLAVKGELTESILEINLLFSKLYYRWSKRDSALVYLLKNYDIIEGGDYPFWAGETYNLLGLHYYREENYARARNYFYRQLAITEDLDETEKLQIRLAAYGNLGMAYNREENDALRDSAEYFLKKKLEMVPDDIGALNELALLYEYREDYPRALEMYKQIYQRGKELNNEYIVSAIANNMANALNSIGRYREALKYAREAEEITQRTGNTDWYLYSLNHQEESNRKLGDYKAAYEIVQKSRKLSDSLNSVEAEERMAELETTYELKEKTTALELSEAENELQLAELEKEKFRNRLALIGLLILLLVAGIIVFFYLRLRKARAALAESNAIKDRFFAVVAHDLRGGFGGFSGIGPIIDRMLDQENYGGVRKITGQLEEESLRLEKMLDSLLQWAFLQLDRINMKPTQLDLQKIIIERLEELDGMARKKDLNIAVEWGVKEAFADRDAVVFILRNLLSNAIKFSHQGGKIRISSTKEDGKVAIHIKDEGVGISEEVMAKIFEAGEKITQTGTSGEKGNGLGLTLSREFAERNNGYIRVESQEGYGSDFIVYLPLAL